MDKEKEKTQAINVKEYNAVKNTERDAGDNPEAHNTVDGSLQNQQSSQDLRKSIKGLKNDLEDIKIVIASDSKNDTDSMSSHDDQVSDVSSGKRKLKSSQFSALNRPATTTGAVTTEVKNLTQNLNLKSSQLIPTSALKTSGIKTGYDNNSEFGYGMG